MIFFENEKFKLIEDGKQVSIQPKIADLALVDINEVLQEFPRVRIKSFVDLQNGLSKHLLEPFVMGELKDCIEIDLAKDEMTAFLRLNMTKEALELEEDKIKNQIMLRLKDLGICVGVKTDVLDTRLLVCKKQVIAEGILPVAGKDAKYKYFQFSEVKPELKDDGKADHYEMNLIDNVLVGDWLGEKTKPYPGIPGETVTGRVLPARAGRDYRLKFDHKSVIEVEEKDKFVLRAKKEGAVKFENGKILVHNHLIIPGDVGFETGNIHFDGDVTIKGTIKDKFVVEATGDISIESDNGIGAVDKIVSKKGSIYIKGGVNGRQETLIIANDSIFVKYVNESHLIAQNIINIGLYSIDSLLKADKIVMDPIKGRLIGGEVEVEHKIIAGSIGNKNERRTRIIVKGFERGNIKKRLATLKSEFESVIATASRLKRQLEIFESNMEKLDERALNSYKSMIDQYEGQIDEINRLNSEVNQLEDTLLTRGDGEIKVHQSVYPKTYLEIKSLQKQIKELMSCSFYVKDRRLHSI
jgi:uncharacterized protein (DUF342 family)